MREVMVATVQMKPKLGEIEANLEKMSDLIGKIAGHQKVDLEKMAADLERQRTTLKAEELKLSQDKVMFYKTSYEVCQGNKKTSFGCKLKRFFTLGIARCK